MDTPTPAPISGDLPRLAIKESSNGFLLPAAARYNLTVIIDFPWLPGDFLAITWAGTPGSGSYTSPRIPIGGFQRPFTTHIDNILVAFNLGQTVIVTYTLYRGTEPPVESQPLPLFVALINQPDLPLPVIKEASDEGDGTHLDVSGLAEVTLRIRSWLLSRREQFFWLQLTGVKVDGSVWEAWYWQAPENVVGNRFSLGYYEQKVPAAPLQGLQNGSVLTMKFWAGLRNSPDLSDAQAFAHRNYIVLTAPVSAPRIERITDPLDQEIAEDGDTLFTSVTLHGAATEEVSVFDGQALLGRAPANAGVWEFPVNGLTEGLHVFTGRYSGGGVSNTRTINVLENREVRIKESTGNTHLNPGAATNALTFVLDYPSQPADQVSVSWTAAPGTPAAGSYTSPAVAVGATPREISAPVSLVAFSIGKAVEGTASYVRGGAPAVQLQPLALSVLPIPSDLLTSPVIDEAKGTLELDKKDIVSGANLTFGGWIHMARGQRLELTLMGFTANGAVNNRSIWTPDRNSVHLAWVTNLGYTLRLPADYLLSLGVGTFLSIMFSVRTDQVANSTAVTVFEPRRYTVVDTR
ncbi:Ig-like domain repeat protein [Pseudomonas bananamidigenes]|uniref:Ig-like domain repeat protein n=1 Tax=Pseudomonas bananamidigenes TaxID=2843610 RepID=UPI0008037DDB|nr:Ig-like domain repeat protein [Pseudomonas bananamidigenes]